MKSFLEKTETVKRKWWIIDASQRPVGRVATVVANLLRGKHKVTFTPNVDCGDFVIVLNSDDSIFTGNKMIEKKYYRHSRFFGSMKSKTAEEVKQDDSTFLIEQAVKGMLPKNKLAYSMLTKLKVYKKGEHPHSAQKPEAFTLPR